MKILSGRNKMLLHKAIKTFVCVIALFSVMFLFTNEVEATPFAYRDFDFDTFYEENKTYWDGVCSSETEERLKEKCEKKLLKAQKKFYTRLYKLLAKYEAAGLHIEDSIIIETVFFGLIASDFTDNSEYYKQDWNTYSNSYNYDESLNEDAYSIEPDYSDSEAAQEYFAKETDTLVTLIRNMIAYETVCYGTYGDVVMDKTADGTEYETCPNGGTAMEIDYYSKRQCADELASFELGFWEFFLSKYANDKMLGIFKQVQFLKLFRVDERYESCMNWGGSYKEMYYDFVEYPPKVSTSRYFDFLKYNIFYDNKHHLQFYFKQRVLEPAGAECMTEELCGEESLEAMGLYEQYEQEIYDIRTEINLYIIEILLNYGIRDITWGQNPLYTTNEIKETAAITQRNSYFWPIGSAETEERDGVVFADGTPTATTFTSPFGPRKDPITGEDSFHYGIDLAAARGTHIVAISDGEVVTVVTGCTEGNLSCGGGYGNYIIIAHPNGDYSLYAHLQSVHESVYVGASVLQGQLIGYMGSTGYSTGSHLHFEIRVGGNSQDNAVDPLTYLSNQEPRPEGASSDFPINETSLTKEEFMSKLAAYCSTNNCSSEFREIFVMNAGLVYDASIANNVNPELVVVRALVEGMSPGKDYNNYWGIGCYNGQGTSACTKYSSLADGIAGFAKTVSKYDSMGEMLQSYAYIGDYWMRVKYNADGSISNSSWSNGGCAYFPYIKKYLSSSRAAYVDEACNTPPLCESINGGPNCKKTTQEDQDAYAEWQASEKMSPTRYNIFGL